MSTRRRLLGLLLVSSLPLAAACTAAQDPIRPAPPVPAPAMRLVAFTSCDELTEQLRKAARTSVGPYGFGFGFGRAETGPPIGGANFRQSQTMTDTGRGAPDAATGSFSQTNNHEADADEPDVVKTDGRRIVTVDDRGILRVVDAAGRRQTGKVDLGLGGNANLLLSGDTALILGWTQVNGLALDRAGPATGPDYGAELLTVDLRGTPRVVSRYRTEGHVVSARRTGTTARVVLRSWPRIGFPELPNVSDDATRLAANRKVVDRARASDWLPDHELTSDGRTVRGEVGCDRVSRPAGYSGGALVTVLTFDLAQPRLTDGDPVTVVADGDTVYATGTSLYVASDDRWRWWLRGADRTSRDDGRTEIYRFDTAGAGRPRYAASGSVPGWLINQYALSEWNGHLRVATTVDGAPGVDPREGVSQSGIHVLRQKGDKLDEVGSVRGLGKTERIYAVRFLGPRGYVVTFRQTDPLYTVDLSDPAKPTVTGELKITGYSSHLQPAGTDRLIGIGQEATKAGRITGTQISLFDVADPGRPKRLARHHIADGSSEAEYDPHALLYWPASNLLVVPLTVYSDDKSSIHSHALALRVTDAGVTRAGTIRHPLSGGWERFDGSIRRSLVIGNVLWTLSGVGLQANDLATLDRLTWLPTA